jgi:hypothetical protein
MDTFSFIAGCFAAIVFVLFFAMVFAFFRPWLRAYTRGGKASFLNLIFMRLRGSPVLLIIDAYTGLLHSGANNITLRQVESHFIANKSRITTADDLMYSIRQDPIETHVAIWIENDDAQWLGEYLADRSDAIQDEMERNHESGNHDANGHMAAQVERCDRIAIRANAAVPKILRTQGQQ